MGYGSYTASDWISLKKSRKLNSENTAENVFTVHSVSEKYDPRCFSVRESRDSEDSPQACPVIIGFDVTASMGYLAKELAVNALNKTVMSVYDNKPVSYPHIMCAAIGDSKCDKSPVQVTQFEADIRIIKQLTELYLEGGGGGNDGESYHLLWYFASRHTSFDEYEKRHKKGIIITIGDDKCHRILTRNEVRSFFSDEIEYDLSSEELLREAEEKYRVFHICIENGSDRDYDVFAQWHSLMPGRVTVINRKNISLLSYLITGIISMASGKTHNETLGCMDQTVSKNLSRSIALISQAEGNKKKTIIF